MNFSYLGFFVVFFSVCIGAFMIGMYYSCLSGGGLMINGVCNDISRSDYCIFEGYFLNKGNNGLLLLNKTDYNFTFHMLNNSAVVLE